jgi:hypothetical protein
VDFFLAICQGLGVALALGALVGVIGARFWTLNVTAAIGAIAGALDAAWSVSIDDQPVVCGVVVGLIGGWLGATVIFGLVSGAAQRAGGGFASPGFIVWIAALALAGISILLPPISIVALFGLGWLAVARRRRADRKYEGLRSLR